MTKEEAKAETKRRIVKPKRKVNPNGSDDIEPDLSLCSKTERSKNPINYKQTAFIKENHDKSIFGIAVNEWLRHSNNDPLVIAAVGGQNLTFYECPVDCNGNIKFLQAYKDPDADEEFYCCAWSYYVPLQNRDEHYGNEDGQFNFAQCVAAQQIVACAGKKGVIRVISPNLGGAIFNLVGHGQSVNELIFHPKAADLLFSFSKDYTVRLWNVWTEVLICIFGGSEGHRSEILHGDVDMSGRYLLSCGMDHTIKVWRLEEEPRVQQAINLSRKFIRAENKYVFTTLLMHFPDFSSNKVHGNYIDCGRWYGGLIFSKSCEGYMMLWKPGPLSGPLIPVFKIGHELKPSIVHQFELQDCDIWYLRFDVDAKRGLLALGNRSGQVFIWNLKESQSSDNSIFDIRPVELTINNKTTCPITVRQTRFVNESKILLCACDRGTIVRFDQV